MDAVVLRFVRSAGFQFRLARSERGHDFGQQPGLQRRRSADGAPEYERTVLITGGGFNGLQHGQHREAPKEDTPLANFWTTMLQDAGIHVDRFADADGTASSLWS